MLRNLLFLTVFYASANGYGDFVRDVNCQAQGMEITLKDQLPIPLGGMWDLEIEGYPKCPGATKTDVGGGHSFTILYADKEWCGVDANYWLTPAWVAVAKVVVLLKDDNETVIADSVSCVYDTRFETSLLTFRGEIASCFHGRNGMVRAFLPKMERNFAGTSYEMKFPAFYFTGYSKNLFVHCTVLACVGTQNLCDSSQECFGVHRRKRDVNAYSMKFNSGEIREKNSREFVMTKYIMIDDRKTESSVPVRPNRQTFTSAYMGGTVCMETPHFFILIGSLAVCLLVLLVAVSCMGGRLAKSRKESREEKRFGCACAFDAQPPKYSTSIQSLPSVTAF